MQISLKGVKGLGFKKIASYYGDVLRTIKIYNSYEPDMKPFSFLSTYNDKISYDGMRMLIDYLEANNCVDKKKKREFRDFWNNLFDFYGDVNNLSQDVVECIKSFGLKCSLVVEDNRVLEFYNSIITWGVFAHQDKNIKVSDFSSEDILTMLIVDSPTEMCQTIKDSIGG